MNYSKLEKLIIANNFSDRKAGKILQMTGTGFRSMLDKHTMTVEKLELFAKYFDKPISYFFDEETNTTTIKEPREDYNVCNECIKKDREIAWLRGEMESVHRILENLSDTKKEKAS